MYVQYLSVAAAVFACMAHYKAVWPLLTNDRFLPVISLLQPLFQYKHGQSRTKINRQYQTLEAAISCPCHLCGGGGGGVQQPRVEGVFVGVGASFFFACIKEM